MQDPFFERAPQAPCREGHLLLVSYHFPPGSAAGVLRWQKLARFAAERGFGLDVVTADPASLPRRDDSRLEDLPDGTRVFGVPDSEPALRKLEHWLWSRLQRLRRRRTPGAAAAAGDPGGGAPSAPRVSSFHRDEVAFEPTAVRSWLRAYDALMVHAREHAWARRASAVGRALVDPSRHRLVISCGPPQMAHEAARRIAASAGLPLVIDLRDPWSQVERLSENLASPVWLWLVHHFERRVFAAADLVVMNSEPARRKMQACYPARRDRIVAVPNGFDDGPLPEVERDERFLIAYAGSVYLDRTPITLFRAAHRLIDELGLAPEQLGIEFMGFFENLDGETVETIAERTGLAGFVATHPAGSHDEAAAFLARASMLVSLPQDSALAIPSKVYEYMRYPARFLVLAERDSASEELLRGSGADIVAPDDEDALLGVLRDSYRQHVEGRPAEPIARDPRFSRGTRARELFDAIDEHVLSG